MHDYNTNSNSQRLNTLRKIGIVILAVAIALEASSSSAGEPSAGEVLDMLDSESSQTRDLMSVYITGIESGASWVNALLIEKGQSQIYCVPKNIGLTGEQVVSIFRGYARNDENVVNYPAGMAVVFAMKKFFPCEY